MKPEENLTGRVFGLLTVKEQAMNIRHRNAFWECHCACGETIYVSGTNLRRGYTTSCGCAQENGK